MIAFSTVAVVTLAALLFPARPPAAPDCTKPFGALARHRITARTDEATARELCHGLSALPSRLRDFPGEPLTIESRDDASPLGMGDGTRERPEWQGGFDTFLLYRFPPDDTFDGADAADDETGTGREHWRLEGLTASERERLWRKRALIHAVIRRWDEAHGWSRSVGWRRAGRWLTPLERPFTWSPRTLHAWEHAFSRRRGAVSPGLDLATFAEEAFAPVESIRADALGVDDRVVCQEFAKFDALRSFLASTDAGVPDHVAPTDCPAFDRWADEESLSHVEVLFAAPTSAAPESLAGHVSLRLVRRDSESVAGPSFDPVIQFVALTGGETAGLAYAARGISGGYPLVVLTTTAGDALAEAKRENRTIRRFHLRLTSVETRRLLQRVWEAERRSYSRYFFFTDNCAAAMLEFIDSALDDERRLRRPGPLWVLPTASLDVLARHRQHDPLLVPIDDPHTAPTDVALDAERRLSTLESRLTAEPSTRPLLAWWNRWRASLPPGEDALEALDSAVRSALASRANRSDVLEWLDALVASSRATAEHAEAARIDVLREAVAAAVDTSSQPTLDELIAERRRDFLREADVQTRSGVVGRIGLQLGELETRPRRPFTQDEARIVARAEQARRAHLDLVDWWSELRDADAEDVSAGTTLASLDAAPPDPTPAIRTPVDGRLPSSGAGRRSFAAGVAFTPTGPVPTLTLRTAAILEEAGDWRARGLVDGAELRFLSGELELTAPVGRPAIVQSRLTLLSWRSFVTPPSFLRRHWWEAIRWGAGFELFNAPVVGVPWQVRTHAELLAVVSDGRAGTPLVAFGLGPQARFEALQARAGAGVRASITARLFFLGGPDSLHLDVAGGPEWFVDGWGALVEASLRGRLVLGRGSARPWLLTPSVGVLHVPSSANPRGETVIRARLSIERS